MKKKYLSGIGLGLFTILSNNWLRDHPDWVEQYYSRTFFSAFRLFWDTLTSFIPFPLMYIFVILIVWMLFKWIKRLITEKPIGKSILNSLLSILSFGGTLIFLFYVMWGFNYHRRPVQDQLGIEPKSSSLEELWEELYSETDSLIFYRNKYSDSEEALSCPTDFYNHLNAELRDNLFDAFEAHHYPTYSRARVHLIHPKGIFLRFSSAGLYFPFTGQGQVDAGLYFLQMPYTMSHEMAHAFGIGDEGECNFWAYLSGLYSEDDLISYACHLAYWRTVAVQVIRYDRENYYAFRDSLPSSIVADLNAINENGKLYPDIMPQFKQKAYTSYLKAQGIEEGMENYNKVIMLVRAWRAEFE